MIFRFFIVRIVNNNKQQLSKQDTQIKQSQYISKNNMQIAAYQQIKQAQNHINSIQVIAGFIQQQKNCLYRNILYCRDNSVAIECFRHYKNNFLKIQVDATAICNESQNQRHEIDFESSQLEIDVSELESSQDFQEKKDVLDFLGKNKLNVYKNILYAFNKHILSCKDEKLIELYESFTQNWNYLHIQRRVSQNLKDNVRPSLKFRNLLKSQNLNKIFIHFLQNIEEFWLKNSKIKDKEVYNNSISLLLKGYEHGTLIKHIQYYRKSKK
ncbi:hypothetical protein TTHERM_000013199 (macronuclear) [Tetrahymena thermophila SB210]|uniref:Uncharacterized protein n=1 Tax=Tetrahymena thermophila (strain SB210) TaxID=312017 RepID=W7XKA9_TETTS|nr:hypothetical protein TTHERM_000013199 [Tetrahymena thermophila SB210]EWS76346.1 hypothetical protein TTHERM_000013199 [Tetrahymena thermophila SB210]|eukprot:XP_012651130.1 hypothetical protein TTHERM_000013199 [Tetrahymena thermophila SB210]